MAGPAPSVPWKHSRHAAGPRRPQTRRSRPREAPVVGIAVGVLSAVWYFTGSGRAFNYDASGSVGRFIATPSLLDPFHRHDFYGNHVYFSFLDHIVYTLTGSRDEHVLRIVPILAAATAVGLVAYELARRFGPIAGVLGAAVMATNPMWVQQGTEARGYSLLVLGAVGSTICLFRLFESRSRALAVLYVIFLGGGIGAHLYALMVLVVHVAIVAAKRNPLKPWIQRWSVALALGIVPTLRVLDYMYQDAKGRPRVFRAKFPLQVASSLLGWVKGEPTTGTIHGSLLSLALTAVIVVVGAWVLWQRPWVKAAAAVIAGMLAAVWLYAPSELYPRFFLWLLPAVAVCTAVAYAGGSVPRRALSMALAIGAVCASVVAIVPAQGRSDLQTRTAARLMDNVYARGGVPCALGLSAPTLVGYTRNYAVLPVPGEATLGSPGPLEVPFNLPDYPRTAQLRQCEMVVVLDTFTRGERQMLPVLRSAFPVETVLKGANATAYVFYRHPGLAPRA